MMLARLYRSRTVLLFAFAFSVMGDPVSSVAYAIEAALRALHGDLALLLEKDRFKEIDNGCANLLEWNGCAI